jgi:hypothetical protein
MNPEARAPAPKVGERYSFPALKYFVMFLKAVGGILASTPEDRSVITAKEPACSIFDIKRFFFFHNNTYKIKNMMNDSI